MPLLKLAAAVALAAAGSNAFPCCGPDRGARPRAPPGPAPAAAPNTKVVATQQELDRVQRECVSVAPTAPNRDFPAAARVPCTILLMPAATPYVFQRYDGAPMLGYFAAVIGTGARPSDTKVQFGESTAEFDLGLGRGLNSVDNVFYRTLQNVEVLNQGLYYAASQMSPLRRLKLHGGLKMQSRAAPGAPATCSDRVKSGGETGVDCGGPFCAPCGAGVGGLLYDIEGVTFVEGASNQQYLVKKASGFDAGAHPPASGEPWIYRQPGQMNFVHLDCTLSDGSAFRPHVPGDALCAAPPEGHPVQNGAIQFGNKNDARAPTVARMSADLKRDVSGYQYPYLVQRSANEPRRVAFKQREFAGASLVEVTHLDAWFWDPKQPLQEGTVYLVHPGKYRLFDTLRVPANSTVMGLGFVIISAPWLAGAAIELGDGATLSSVVVDAGLLGTKQEALVRVTGDGAQLFDFAGRTNLDSANWNPSAYVHTMLEVRGADAYIENAWLWRGDHFATVRHPPPAQNVNPYGIHVTGPRATAVGLFVEHQSEQPIVWDGADGLVIMSQGETSYDDNAVSDAGTFAAAAGRLHDAADAGVYMLVGPNAAGFDMIGGGIYNIFGTDKAAARSAAATRRPALRLYRDDTQIAATVFAGWAGSNYWSSLFGEGCLSDAFGAELRQPMVYLCSLSDLRDAVSGEEGCRAAAAP